VHWYLLRVVLYILALTQIIFYSKHNNLNFVLQMSMNAGSFLTHVLRVRVATTQLVHTRVRVMKATAVMETAVKVC